MLHALLMIACVLRIEDENTPVPIKTHPYGPLRVMLPDALRDAFIAFDLTNEASMLRWRLPIIKDSGN